MPTTTSICSSVRLLEKQIFDYLTEVPSAGEESITDYLAWQWSKIDRRFKFVNFETHTRQMEGTTSGADFSMDLWLVGRRFTIPILVQAKKFVHEHDNYRSRFRYPAGTRGQLRLLMEYSRENQRFPLYAIYSPVEAFSCCKTKSQHVGVHLLSPRVVRTFSSRRLRSPLSLTTILSAAAPMFTFFCCLDPVHLALVAIGSSRYRRILRSTSNLPSTIATLVDSDAKLSTDIQSTDSVSSRILAVLDIREEI